MRITLFGKSGQVGRELEPLLSPLGTLAAFDRGDVDLERPASIRETLRRERPDVLVNAAAYTAVDRAEAEPERARLVNAEAVAVMAEEMADSGGWFVHYSTDYVFDGTKSGGSVETDPAAPLNVYGATKLAGERLVAESGCRHLIFRTSWVYAAHGHNFLRTMLRLLQERDEIAVVDDQVGAPTSASLIAGVTADIVRGLWGTPVGQPASGIYHLAAAGATSWHGYAEFIAAAARAERQDELDGTRRPALRRGGQRAERQRGHAERQRTQTMRHRTHHTTPYGYCAALMPRMRPASAACACCFSIACANSCGPPGLTTCPVAVRRCTIMGSASTSRTSAAIRSRTAGAISFGPNRPTSPSMVTSGKPASPTVGTSGSIEARWLAVMASSFSLPESKCGRRIA